MSVAESQLPCPPSGLMARNASESLAPHLWDGLVLGMPMIERSRGPRDYSGLGNHGTLNGNPQWVSQSWGSALEFDGNGDYVGTPNDPLSGVDSWTILIWINSTTTGDDYAYISPDDGAATWLGIANFSAELGMRYHGTWLYSNSNALVADIHDGNWHLVGSSFDGVTGRLWFDGEQVNSTTSWSSSWPLSTFLRVGTRGDGANDFSGKTGNALIYDRALNSAQIGDLYDCRFRMFHRRSRLDDYAAMVAATLGGGGTTDFPFGLYYSGALVA